MTLTKTLMAGAAACALCASPAFAGVAPSIHVAALPTTLHMKSNGALHGKTDAGNPNATHFTETITFFGTLSSAEKGSAIMLWGETWYNSVTCAAPTDEVAHFPKHTMGGRISVGTSTGTISGCGSKIYTFYGPDYTLHEHHVKSDSFHGAIHARHFGGYNLLLNANTDLNII